VIYNTDVDDLQVYDGSAWLPVLSVGSGQTWHDVTASRSGGTNYVNNTGRPISVLVTFGAQAGANRADLLIDGDAVASTGNTGNRSNITAIVPPGSTYRVNIISGTFDVENWQELR